MAGRDEDGFDIRPGTPKGRHQRFVSQVIREASKAGGRAMNRPAARTGASLGRGKVASRMMGQGLGRKARRVVIKTRLVNLQRAGLRSTITHLKYIEREGVGPDGEKGQAYGPHTDDADMDGFERRVRDDRHQFRFIVSPADADQLGDLKSYTRELMTQVQADLATSLDWVAVDHWNTDNPHTHIVLRGKQQDGQDLVIAREYIGTGMRQRGSEIATRWLGPRTEMEIQREQQREVQRPTWTGLDRTLQRMARDGRISLQGIFEQCRDKHYCKLLIGRVQYLESIGLCDSALGKEWELARNIKVKLVGLSKGHGVALAQGYSLLCWRK